MLEILFYNRGNGAEIRQRSVRATSGTPWPPVCIISAHQILCLRARAPCFQRQPFETRLPLESFGHLLPLETRLSPSSSIFVNGRS